MELALAVVLKAVHAREKLWSNSRVFTSTNVTDWSTDNWDFGTTTQLPQLKYAEIAAYCTNSTYTTKETCEAASSRWVAEGDECNGETGVVCGDIIPGQ